MTVQASFRVDGISGCLGRHVKSYQKTLKCKPGETPWREVSVEATSEATVQISFDGRTYHEPLILEGAENLDFIWLRGPFGLRCAGVRIL